VQALQRLLRALGLHLISGGRTIVIADLLRQARSANKPVGKLLDKLVARLPPERIQHFGGIINVLPELVKDPLGFLIRGRRWPLGRTLAGV